MSSSGDSARGDRCVPAVGAVARAVAADESSPAASRAAWTEAILQRLAWTTARVAVIPVEEVETASAVATAGVAEEVADAEPRGAAVGVAVSAVAASSVERISAFHWASLSVKVRAHTSSNLP